MSTLVAALMLGITVLFVGLAMDAVRQAGRDMRNSHKPAARG